MSEFAIDPENNGLIEKLGEVAYREMVMDPDRPPVRERRRAGLHLGPRRHHFPPAGRRLPRRMCPKRLPRRVRERVAGVAEARGLEVFAS